MGVKLNTGLGGSITIDATNTASNVTATLPAVSGTVQVQNNMPAFYAYSNTTQSISTNTFVKIAFPLEGFDTNSNFDNVTNYRFTPTVSGYYQISGAVYANGTNRLIVSIFKNGSEFMRGTDISATAGYSGMVSGLIYFNGTTDYVELYVNSGNVGTINFAGATALNWFTGALIRNA